MAETLKQWVDYDNWSSSSSASSPSSSVMLNTILLLTLVTIGIFLIPVIHSLSWSFKLKRKGRPPLPPGRMGLPILGETISFVVNPRAFMESRHAKYGPMFKSNVMGETVFLQAPANNKFLFPNESKLVQMSWPTSIKKIVGKNSMLTKTGDAYKRSRRHINPILSPSALAPYVARIERNVRSHLAKSWQPPVGANKEQEQEFELAIWEPMIKITFRIIADLILSMSPDDPYIEELRGLFGFWTAGLVTTPINVPGTAHHRALKAQSRILAILGKLIVKRREELKEGKATPSQDFLSYFLTEPDDSGEMTSDAEIKDTLLFFLNAGHSTSSHVLTLTLRSIALHPVVYDRLKKEHDSIAARKTDGEGLTKEDLAEMKYTWCVIQETMRVVAPVQGGFREMITDVELDGFTIPKGWKMNWTTASHMDPKTFEEPTKFDPTRFEDKHDIPSYVYAPFGGGQRICPGNDFAKMEMLIYMHLVIRNYKFTLVDPDEPIYYDPFPTQKSGTLMRVRRL